jgi:hypothetical protein
VAWDSSRPGTTSAGNGEPHQVLGLGARGGVAVEQAARHAGDHELVRVEVVLRIGGGEVRIAFQDRRPRAAARIGAERLAFLRDQRHDRIEPVLLHESEVLGETLLALDAVFGAAHTATTGSCSSPIAGTRRRMPSRRCSPCSRR